MLSRTGLLIAAALLVATACGGAWSAVVTSESPLGTAGVGKTEVSLGDLVADSIRSSIKADIAMLAASELKERDAQIPKGQVSTADVARYIAYADDPLVEVRLTGRQVKLALERSVLISPQRNLGFLQVSGMKFTFDPAKPQENRVTSVKIGDKPLADGQTYSVAMTSSLANGALGYWKIWSKNDIRRVSKVTIPQAVEEFLSRRTSINYSVLNRIATGS